jgi:hypothetical protein
MDIDIHVPTEHMDQLTLHVNTDADLLSVGWKRYRSIGEFKYDWVIEYLDRDDITALRDILNYVLSITGDGPEES